MTFTVNIKEKIKRNIISSEHNNSVHAGRATAVVSPSPMTANSMANLKRGFAVPHSMENLWQKYRDPKEYHSNNLGNYQKDHTALADQPLIKQINLDLAFSRIGTIAMLLRSVFSGIFGSSKDNDPATTQTRKFDVLDDFLHKIRQQAQYSIHAQPGGHLRKPDDIASDMVENMVAASLGSNVYKLNAFVAPWISLFKVFFPYNDNPVWGLPARMAEFVDNTAGKLTNIFWNIRRVGKALIAYDGGISTEAFRKKQNEVSEVISYYTNRFLFNPKLKVNKPIMRLWNKIFSTNTEVNFDEAQLEVSSQKKERISALTKEMFTNFWNNLKAVFSDKYECAHQGGIKKKVGIEEPENQNWYVRSKIFSKCIGLPAGAIGAMLNGTGIVMNFLGSFFNMPNLRILSDKATDMANGLMSLVYLTGEVPANLNEYIKKGIQGSDPHRRRNFAVFTVGLLGMLNRIKVLPGIKQVMEMFQVKKLLDKFDGVLRHFFLLFFSYNRLVLHSDEKAKHEATAAVRDLKAAEKHNNLSSHLVLPFRVLMNDEQVTHRHQGANSKSQAA